MKDHKNIWAWVGVAIVVIAAVVWAAVAVMQKQPGQQATGPTPVYAPQGQLTPNFPADLIIDSSTAISQSYSINYSSSTNLYTAIYDSSSSMKMMFQDYMGYFASSTVWKVARVYVEPTYDSIAVTNGNGQAQVVISTQGTGSHVAIGYGSK